MSELAAGTPDHPQHLHRRHRAGVDTGRESTVNRERVIVLLVGIALGMYVVPRVRAKVGV